MEHKHNELRKQIRDAFVDDEKSGMFPTVDWVMNYLITQGRIVQDGYVAVPMEQWQPIETYDYKNFPEVWLAAWIEPSEYAKENGASAHWDIGMGRCWHVNTRKFTGVLGGSPTYWCKTNKPDLPSQKGNAK